MASDIFPQRCCALLKYTLQQCSYNSKFITEENLHVCRYHLEYTLEDIQILNNKIEIQLKIKQKTDAIKLEKKNIKDYNETLLTTHPGEIPLRDITRKIVNFTFVDAEDYDEVMKHTWHQAKQKGDLIYVHSHINNIKISLHHFILGKPENDNIIHHRDHNGLNNKRSNIVIASLALNNQHRFKRENSINKYIGVTYTTKNAKKWHVQSNKVNLGNYYDEMEAAKIYDTYVYLKYKVEAHTNGLVNYDDIKHIDINTLIKKKERELPTNISKSTINTYRVMISYNGNNYLSFEPNLDAAKEKTKSI